MRKGKRGIIAVFIGTFIFLAGYSLAQKTEISGEAIVSEKIEYKAEGLRDPFQEEGEAIGKIINQQTAVGESEVQPLPSLEIQGIVWGGKFPQAIINNKVLKVGDTIEGARIIAIAKSGVTVSFYNRQYDLFSPASLNLSNKDVKGKP